MGEQLELSSTPQHQEPLNLENDEEGSENKRQPIFMDTVMGVFIPCLQSMFGVLFFIRLPWIVGTAGILEAFLAVLLCCTVTFLTSISLSAIATNGAVSGGGPYKMISGMFGRELGGAVGILLYFGTTFSASLQFLGAIEMLLLHLIRQAQLVEDMYNNFRLFGSLLLALVGLLIVRGGVKVVNKFALPTVLITIACIACTFMGIFSKLDGNKSPEFCMVGNRPVDVSNFQRLHGYVPNCTAEGLLIVFCLDPNSKEAGANCDRYFEHVLQKDPSSIRYEPVIPGISSGVFFENLYSKYRRNGDVLSRLDSKTAELPPDPSNKRTAFWVFADTTTSFMVMVGVFFPSVTGIMAGTNRADNLRDASRSIPMGTLAAQLTASVVYLSGAVLFGSSVAEMFLRDKFGQSAAGKLVAAELAVPHPLLILVGCCVSAIGAGMHALTNAHHLLQAILADDLLPFLGPFKKTDTSGKPIRAISLTLCICWLGILIGVLEHITALITHCFLACYLGVNAACALQSLMKAPGWHPSFQCFHWSLSGLGVFLCAAAMFASAEWYFALLAALIGVGVYKYIEYVDAKKRLEEGL